MKPDDAANYEDLRIGFTAAVSHELRTPLARVNVLLENASLPGADVRSLISQARAEIDQASALVDEILFLSELEDQELTARGRTRLAGVVAEVLSDLRDRAEVEEVELRADVEPGFELPLRRRLARAIVANLAENAVRHAGSGAVFTLQARRQDRRALVIGTDTGRGVARSHLPRLFERFYRADRARASRGSGLGLAIVKHIVVASGGEIDAGINADGGLVIRCVFPPAA